MATRKKKRKKITTKKLDDLLRIAIRLRDKDLCQHCGKLVYGSNSHPSHVIPKSRGLKYRWYLDNVKIFCMSCHQWWHLNPMESSDWFAEHFTERWEILKQLKNEDSMLKIDKEAIKDYLEKYIIEMNMRG